MGEYERLEEEEREDGNEDKQEHSEWEPECKVVPDLSVKSRPKEQINNHALIFFITIFLH